MIRVILFLLLSITTVYGQLRVLPGVSGKTVSAVTPPVESNITDIAITVRPDQYIGTNVSVTATPTGTVTDWKWRVLHRYPHTGGRFDTLLHETSSLQNPSFSIDSTGFYDIKLTARNGTDKYEKTWTRIFRVFKPRVAQGSADVVVNVSSGSYYHDFGPDGDMSGKIIFMTGVGSNSQVEFRNLHADDPDNPVYIQKAADNTKVEFTFTGGSGKVWHFSQYAAGEGARNIVVNGFNLDGTPGIKVSAGASSTITIRVEGKLTDVGFYGVEVVSDPVNIDGAAIAIVPTVGSTCNISNHETNNLHMWHCTITAGEEAGYFGESLQDPDYIGNNGFMPPQGTGIVMSRNTILGAGRDGLQSSLIGEGEDNYISNYGQQNGQSGEAGHQACLVSNDGSAMAWRRNYCINGEYFANIKSGLQPWASLSGQTAPQETILEGNVYFAGTFPGTDQEPFAIYIQNNPESGAATWPISIRNNTIYTDKKAIESLLALGGVSETMVIANNIIIKTGNAGDYAEFNWTGNGNPSLIASETVNNQVYNVGDDLSGFYFTDYTTGDFSITNTGSAAYSGSPTNTSLNTFDYLGFPNPVPVSGYYFGAFSSYNLRTIAP